MAVETFVAESEVQSRRRAGGESARRGRPDTSGSSRPAGVPHGLRGVIMAVEIVVSRRTRPRRAETASGNRAPWRFRARRRCRRGGHHGGGGAGKGAFAAPEHVHEAAVGVLAALEVLDRSGRSFRWARRGRRSGPPAGPSPGRRDRDVGVAALRLVAPAALAVLRVDDQLDGLGQLLAELGPRRHAITLGQKHAWRSRGRTSAVAGVAGRR